jgi:hypothetical protein
MAFSTLWAECPPVCHAKSGNFFKMCGPVATLAELNHLPDCRAVCEPIEPDIDFFKLN